MNNYIIELAAIHVAFIAAYLLLLRKERQYGTMRFYLIASTLLAVIIPLIELPNPFYKPAVLTNVPLDKPLPEDELFLSTVNEASSLNTNIIIGVYMAISIFFFFKLLVSVVHIIQIKNQSTYKNLDDQYLQTTGNVKGSFSFFNWVFLSDKIIKSEKDADIILKHEQAHVYLKHTYDLIFFELFKIAFWWLPTTWYVINEIKRIHEFQADTHAISKCDVNQYSSTLISSTLKTNGWSLASSFHDGLILKRLKAMKEQRKNISAWKLGTLSILLATLFVTFSCTEESNSTATKENETNSTSHALEDGNVFIAVEQLPEYPGGLGELYSYISKEIQYPKVARMQGIEGKVWVQLVIEKDGTISNV
ncbi:MAG: energy transducer TonB [Cyclobacteriaceae bacterium]